VARHLFQWKAEPRYADFYERALLNGIVGNQDRRDPTKGTSYIYMLPLGGAVKKAWGKSDFGFPCCWGTLSESFAKLSDSIFFAAADGGAVYVNQYVSAAVHLTYGVRLIQESSDLTTDLTSTLRLSIGSDVKNASTAILVRVPGWLGKPCTGCVKLNGVALGGVAAPGSYFKVSPPGGVWMDGDTVTLHFAPTLWTAPLNDYHPEHNATLAFMFGPLVLAGLHLPTDVFVPLGGTARARSDPASFITRNSTPGAPLEFFGLSAAGQRIHLIPLRDVADEQYVAYFMTAGTKPPQPPVRYCPHSAGGGAALVEISEQELQEVEVDEERLVSAGPPSLPPASTEAATEAVTEVIRSRGVTWSLSGGRVGSHAKPA